MAAAINRLLLALWCAAPSSWFRKGGLQMKTPDTTKAVSSAPSKREFTGTDNPRHLRALAVLLRRPVPREQLDSIAGCANGPALISDLRRLGLGDDHLRCERIKFIDRDGNVCRPGVYHLTGKGRRMVYAWMAQRKKNGGF